MDESTIIAIAFGVLALLVVLIVALRTGPRSFSGGSPAARAPLPDPDLRSAPKETGPTGDAPAGTSEAKTVASEAPPASSIAPNAFDVPTIPPRNRESTRPRDGVAELRKGLSSTRGGFIARLARLFSGRKDIDPALLEQVQEVLITADVGVRTSEQMLEALRAKQSRGELRIEGDVWSAIRDEARAILGPTVGGVHLPYKPTVVLVIGVNGVGKTTTIGKLASRLRDDGKKVLLAAGDTFRAAAVLQLETWAKKIGCEVVKGTERADPASVIFDAIKRAESDGADVMIADTAGRLHTKANLMEELKKVVRSAEKALGRPVDEILLVLDSTTGQNAISQAQLFKEAVPVSGIVLTKLDGTAKGGVVLGIACEHRIPVRYIGIGERVDDLREFDGAQFVEALFGRPEEETVAA